MAQLDSIDAEQVRRRLRAARIIAGFNRMEDLAEKMGVGGLGTDTLYDVERGKRTIQPHELRLVAEACSLPYEFFTADFHLLADAPERRHTADMTLQEINDGVRELLERWREEAMPAFTAYLDEKAAEAHDAEDRTSDERSASRQDRRP